MRAARRTTSSGWQRLAQAEALELPFEFLLFARVLFLSPRPVRARWKMTAFRSRR